jgi:hypothetical protein
MGDCRTFTVKIYYREPTYELRVGAKADPYSMQYEIRSHDQDEAILYAIAALNRSLPDSSVGWIRDVVGVSVDGVDVPVPVSRATPTELPSSGTSPATTVSADVEQRRFYVAITVALAIALALVFFLSQ